MGDLSVDTALTGGGGRYTATLSRDWEIWGPNGGYIAAILLRAAGAHASHPRPVSLAVHFLGSASFEEVQVETTTLRAGRRSESVRVSMRQGDRAIAEAMVWTVAERTEGPEFTHEVMPAVPAPEDLPLIQDLLPEDDPPFPFWRNFAFRPLDFLSREQWARRQGLDPVARGWMRFQPRATFDDLFLEAARVTIILDTEGWPAAARGFSELDGTWIAPNMDVHISFHDAPAGAEDLYFELVAPVSRSGLIGATGRVWSPDGRLLGTGIQQMMLRNMPNPHHR